MRTFPQEAERVESGAVKFGDDWPGMWLRGDDAFGLSQNIQAVWRPSTRAKRYPANSI